MKNMRQTLMKANSRVVIKKLKLNNTILKLLKYYLLDYLVNIFCFLP